MEVTIKNVADRCCPYTSTHAHSSRALVLTAVPGTELGLGSTGSWAWVVWPLGEKSRGGAGADGLRRALPRAAAGGRAHARGSVKRAFCPSARPVVGRCGGKIRVRRRGRSLYELALLPGVAAGMEEDEGADEQQQLSYRQVQEKRASRLGWGRTAPRL